MNLSTCEICGGHIPVGIRSTNKCEKCGAPVVALLGKESCTWTKYNNMVRIAGCLMQFWHYVPECKYCPFCGKLIKLEEK